LAKTEVARFLERLHLKAIILHEQASAGNTIIEKIERHTNVGFGIVLYTPCDIGAKAEDNPNLQNRARQNVVFEHGYLIGKIGRNRVCALVKGKIETPNDISGVVYVTMDGEWKWKIAKELKESGYSIDMNLI
jgi:predicted nucleotide-binding protein